MKTKKDKECEFLIHQAKVKCLQGPQFAVETDTQLLLAPNMICGMYIM